jgi:hypothetical protein
MGRGQRLSEATGKSGGLGQLEVARRRGLLSLLITGSWPAQSRPRPERGIPGYRKGIWFRIPRRRALLNITAEIEKAVRRSEIHERLCLVDPRHITSSVFVNDDEPGLRESVDRWLEGLAPHETAGSCEHNRA